MTKHVSLVHAAHHVFIDEHVCIEGEGGCPPVLPILLIPVEDDYPASAWDVSEPDDEQETLW